jgi:hypothetical protein
MKQEQTQKAQLNKEQREQIEDAVREMRRNVEKNIEHRLKTEQDLESEPEEPEGSRKKLANAVEREKDEDESWEKALDDYIKGVGYTIVNRLTALRSMEVRGFIDREVTQFKGAKTPAAEPIIDEEFETEQNATLLAYNRKCKELSKDIQILFDPESPYHVVRPNYDVYKDLCEILDEIDDSLWLADDVLGWVYEYYNVDDLEAVREKAREEGLDAEDTTIANQFYTPHWVVRMLTDNSLGKLYLEENNKLLSAIDEQEDLSIEERQERSTHPSETPRVEDLCTYLVPTEEEGESTNYDDPSEIRVIDPACGSGHFLLYAFDVLERIWRDERPEIPNEEIPAKILENNIYGVDLDLRACQLASFNLYLKARTRAQDEGKENFQMPEVGIVCSDSSISNLEEAEEVFEEVAGEETELRNRLEEILEEFEEIDGLGSLLDVKGRLSEEFVQEGLHRDLSQFEDNGYGSLNSFLDALHDEIEEKHSNGKFLAQDLQSFLRVVKILSQNYDVSLMNPPYGSRSRMPDPVQEYVEENYSYHNEYYINFFEVCDNLSKTNGRIGMLVPWSFTFQKAFREFRKDFIGKEGKFEFLSEFGYGILDNATVGTVGTVVNTDVSNDDKGTFLRLHDIDSEDKESSFLHASFVDEYEGEVKRRYEKDVGEFSKAPGAPISYWIPTKIRELYDSEMVLDAENADLGDRKSLGDVKQGIATGNDDRFYHFFWEVEGRKDYTPIAKGGSDSWLLPRITREVLWGNSGNEVKRFEGSNPSNEQYYFQSGITFNSRKWDGRVFGYLNSNSIFSHAGNAFFQDELSDWSVIAYLNSRLITYLKLGLVPERHWEVSTVSRFPVLDVLEENEEEFEEMAKEVTGDILTKRTTDFISPYFQGCALARSAGHTENNLEYDHAHKSLLNDLEVRKFPKVEESESIQEIFDEIELFFEEIDEEMDEKAEKIDSKLFQYAGIEDKREEVMRELNLRTTEDIEDDGSEAKGLYERDIQEAVIRLLTQFSIKIAQENGVVPITKESDDEDSDLMDHVVEKFEDVWREYADERLAEADQILGDERSGEEAYPNIRKWLENDLFEFHLKEFENTPILWKITTARMVQEPKSEGFACIVDYHQLDSGIFDKLKNLMEPRKSALRENRKDADRRRSDGSLSAEEQSKAVEEYERCDDALRQIDEFESTIRELGENNPRDWSKEDQELAENLAPKVREFRTRTKKRLKTLDQLREEVDEDWLEDMFSPTFFDRVDENREEWIDALQDLEKACKEYGKDSNEPVEAHLYDLFVYFQDIVGSTHYGSNDITFMNYYFSKGDKFLDDGEPREGLTGKEKLMAELASETDEDVELADELKDACSDIESRISSEWKDRAIQEVTVEGYIPVKKHGVAINIEPLADKSIVPQIVEDKVI